jgi:hypothetical protein
VDEYEYVGEDEDGDGDEDEDEDEDEDDIDPEDKDDDDPLTLQQLIIMTLHQVSPGPCQASFFLLLCHLSQIHKSRRLQA